MAKKSKPPPTHTQREKKGIWITAGIVPWCQTLQAKLHTYKWYFSNPLKRPFTQTWFTFETSEGRRERTLFVAERSKRGGRLPSWEWDWFKTRKHPARLMSQKRIAPSHPPVTKTHSLEVDHSTAITPSAIVEWYSQELVNTTLQLTITAINGNQKNEKLNIEQVNKSFPKDQLYLLEGCKQLKLL